MSQLPKTTANAHRAKPPSSGETRARHKHKRFHVRPEAVGVGYETHRSVWPLAPAAKPAEGVPDPEAVSEPAELQSGEEAGGQAKLLLEKEFLRIAAVRGMQLCAVLLGCVLVTMFVRAHFDSFKEFGRQLFNTTAPPIERKHLS
jgi:hypothetical protein